MPNCWAMGDTMLFSKKFSHSTLPATLCSDPLCGWMKLASWFSIAPNTKWKKRATSSSGFPNSDDNTFQSVIMCAYKNFERLNWGGTSVCDCWIMLSTACNPCCPFAAAPTSKQEWKRKRKTLNDTGDMLLSVSIDHVREEQIYTVTERTRIIINERLTDNHQLHKND